MNRAPSREPGSVPGKEATMPVGKVKWFDNRKGWGFVIQPDGTDLFVHYTSIEGDGFRRLNDGEEVEYEPVQGPKGPQAGNVRPLNRPTEVPSRGATAGTPDPANSANEEAASG